MVEVTEINEVSDSDLAIIQVDAAEEFVELSLLQFPDELLLHALSFLSLHQFVALRLLCHSLKNLTYDSLFWKRRVNAHFPHRYKDALVEEEVSRLEGMQFDWHHKFVALYDGEYSGLDEPTRRLFSLVKESDINSLRLFRVSAQSLEKKDANNKSPFDWIDPANRQVFLDCFYQIALHDYQLKDNENALDVAKVDEHGRTILYWALVCHQSLEQVELLLAQGSQTNEVYFGNKVKYQPIHVAAQEGLTDVVKGLLKQTPGLLNQVTATQCVALSLAADRGHLSVVEFLLLQPDVRLNVRSTEESQLGWAPLHMAIKKRHTPIVAALVAAGADMALGGFHAHGGKSAEHFAAELGDVSVVAAIIDNVEDKWHLLTQRDYLGRTPLMIAAQHGCLDVVKLILLHIHHFDIDAAMTSVTIGWTALHLAVRHGHNCVVEELIRCGMLKYLNTNSHLNRFMHLAAEWGHLTVVQLFNKLLPGQLNSRDESGATPLMVAARNGQLSVVEYLLQQENIELEFSIFDDPESESNGWTALRYAFEANHYDVVAALVKKGAKIIDVTSESLLHLAMMRGNLEMVRVLIESSVNRVATLNLVNSRGVTPLTFAVELNQVEIVEYLLQQEGIELDARVPSGLTVLHWAINKDYSQIVAAFIKREANITCWMADKQVSPLYVAVLANSMSVVKVLLDNNSALANQRFSDGTTPLILAVKSNRFDLFQLLATRVDDLLAKTKTPQDKNTDGWMALHWAASAGQFSFVNCLLEFEVVRAELKRASGSLALHLAAKHGYHTVTTALVEEGASVTLPTLPIQSHLIHASARNGNVDRLRMLLDNAQDKTTLLNRQDACGQTPLLLAAANGHLSMVEFLLTQPGINLQAATRDVNNAFVDGMTALHWAALFEHDAIFQLLLRHGANIKQGKPVRGCRLSERAKEDRLFGDNGMVVLDEYIATRKAEGGSMGSIFSIFSRGIGISQREKVTAAEALKKVMQGDERPSILIPHKKALSQGRLGEICQTLIKRYPDKFEETDLVRRSSLRMQNW